MSPAEDRSEPHLLNDPELRMEFELLESVEDRRDFLVAMEAPAEVEKEGTVP
ncbi:MAG: hypothetical protein V2B18_09230 [Pseudomonadota bacterium]